VDPRAGLGDLEKRKFFTLPGLELRPLGRPARSQSLYQLPLTVALSELCFKWKGRAGFKGKRRSLRDLHKTGIGFIAYIDLLV
jgi:hypothetical protein